MISKMKPHWGKVASYTQLVPHIGSAWQGPYLHQVSFKVWVAGVQGNGFHCL